MLPNQHATHLINSVTAIAQAAEEAQRAAQALAPGSANAAGGPWLPGILEALARIQLDCAEIRYATRELRDELPAPSELQPRLI